MVSLTAPPAFGRRTAPRSNQPRHLGQHNLLTDTTEPARRGGRGDFLGGMSRHRHRAGRDGTDYNEWVQSLEDMIGTGAGQLLEQVFGNMTHMGAPPALPPVTPRAAADSRSPVDLLQNLINGLNGRAGAGSRHRHVHQSDSRSNATTVEMQVVNEVLRSSAPSPSSTSDRWSDESAIFSGGLQASERISIIAKRVNAMLLPAKQRRDQEQREKDEKEKAEREKEIQEREKVQAAETAQDMANQQASSNQIGDAEMSTPAPENQASQETAPAPEGRIPWRERIERRRQAQAAQTAETHVANNDHETVSVPEDSTMAQAISAPGASRDELTEVLNLAARLSANDAATTATSTSASTSEPHTNLAEDEPMGRQESTTNPVGESTTTALGTVHPVEQQVEAQGGTSNAPQRITIQVHGNTVDITDTGIDPTFLEALPDDMREEVLNQHSRETRAAAAVAPTNQAVPSSINSEFLNALPPELRAEVLAQEAMEAARLRAATAAPAVPQAAEGTAAGGNGAAGEPNAGGAASAEPLEMDPVAFLASLDPHLRQTVLLEQGEEMLGALPPDMLEE